MNNKSRYIICVVVVTLNLLVLMMRIMSDYAGPSDGREGNISMLSMLKRSYNSSGLLGVDETRPVQKKLHADFHSVLHCHNQSECIKPHLQLKRDITVYLCKRTSRGGVRFHMLATDGLRSHPRVRLLEGKSGLERAEYVIYLPNSAPWHKTECNATTLATRLIVLDEFDLHQNFAPFASKEERLRHYPVADHSVLWNHVYFKRSFVRRRDGLFLGYPHLAKRDIFPLTYSIPEAYIQSPFARHDDERDIDVLCTLRGSKRQSTRLRVQEGVQAYIDSHTHTLANSVAKQLDASSRKEVSREYFGRMRRAKIVVTVNPAGWEGDFRLWEALSSGALVLVDPLLVPHPHPLKDGQHVVFFQQSNASDLTSKLDYFLAPEHREEARSIAMAGYLHAMTHHRTACSVDYVLRTAEVKKHDMSPSSYSFTGQSLVAQTRSQEATIKRNKLPGLYEEYV